MERGAEARLLDAEEVRVEAALQGGHELDAFLAGVVDGLDGLDQVGRQRLLAEDVLARVRARLDLSRVELRRRAEPHRLDVRVVDHVLLVRGGDDAREALDGGLGL